MKEEELDRLASLIADALREVAPARAHDPAREWVPAPVRPEPPARGGEPAPWTGAGQVLGDVAPVREPTASVHRVDPAELTRAVRAAAAGQAAPPAAGARGTRPPSRRRATALPVAVRVGVSNRHIHLSAAHVRALFGSETLAVARPILQPGQFAARETVTVEGPAGRIENVRIVGPPRGDTQVELSRSDAARIGIDPPVAASGSLDQSVGGVTLVGPNGRVSLGRGVIVAARHLHVSPADARAWGLGPGDLLDVRCGSGPRAATWHDVLVRTGDTHATELHLDRDEANACGAATGDEARVVRWRGARSTRRPLVTERDVIAIARAGGEIPPGALLTPSARDRARSLRLLDA